MADWTPKELAVINGSHFDSIGHERILKLELSHDDDPFLQAILADTAPVPVRVDWRNVPNRVSEVKSQRKCQASWAFAATGVLEGQQMERNLLKEPVSLSEQQIIDAACWRLHWWTNRYRLEDHRRIGRNRRRIRLCLQEM